jgi:hypothetical protein
MGAAAYNRGSALLAREADAAMPSASARADRSAAKEHVERLQGRVVALEHELARARRCIAELRRSKAERLTEARVELARTQLSISILCRIAFPGDST